MTRLIRTDDMYQGQQSQDQQIAALGRTLSQNITNGAIGTGLNIIQNGVLRAADAVVTGISVASGTGAITFSVAAATPMYIKDAVGNLVAASFSAFTTTLTPGSLPTSTLYAAVGVEVDAQGNASLNVAANNQASSAAAINASAATIAAGGKIRIADIIILNTSGSYSLSTNIDRRPWVRGVSGLFACANLGIPGGSLGLLGSLRCEFTGVPAHLTISGFNDTVGATFWDWSFNDNGATLTFQTPPTSASPNGPAFIETYFTPTAGSHLIQYYLQLGGGGASGTFFNPYIGAFEMLGGNSYNGTV